MSERKRVGVVSRKTKETAITLKWELDGNGHSTITTGIGFFDHMLEALTRHGWFNLHLECHGDLDVDGHHTVEDVGICLGQAFAQSIENGAGITRYGSASIPMDEALVHAVVDISGRPYLVLNLNLPQQRAGDFDCCLVEEFFRAFVTNAGVTLHIRQLAGSNSHHIIEATFKAVAKALDQACTTDSRIKGSLSTKGMLDLGRTQLS